MLLIYYFFGLSQEDWIMRNNEIKVLVVEDNIDAQVTICEMLSILNYEAYGVTNGLDALGMIKDYDILLTDLNLPGMNGIELVRQTKAINPLIAIIISSGMDINIELDTEFQILPKPFTMTLLNNVLQKVRPKADKS